MLTKEEQSILESIKREYDEAEDKIDALMKKSDEIIQPMKDRKDFDSLREAMPFLPMVNKAFLMDFFRQNNQSFLRKNQI